MSVLKYYDPTTQKWLSVGGAGGIDIPVQDTPPENADFWIDTSDTVESNIYTKEEVDAMLAEVAKNLEEVIENSSKITYGTEDLVEGESELAEGVVYFVVEE